jgi:hypothetical protein
MDGRSSGDFMKLEAHFYQANKAAATISVFADTRRQSQTYKVNMALVAFMLAIRRLVDVILSLLQDDLSGRMTEL